MTDTAKIAALLIERDSLVEELRLLPMRIAKLQIKINQEVRPLNTSSGLTEQQELTAEMLLAGLSHKEIGDKLSISKSTVCYHARAVYRSLNVQNQQELRDAYLAEGIHNRRKPTRGSSLRARTNAQHNTQLHAVGQ